MHLFNSIVFALVVTILSSVQSAPQRSAYCGNKYEISVAGSGIFCMDYIPCSGYPYNVPSNSCPGVGAKSFDNAYTLSQGSCCAPISTQGSEVVYGCVIPTQSTQCIGPITTPSPSPPVVPVPTSTPSPSLRTPQPSPSPNPGLPDQDDQGQGNNNQDTKGGEDQNDNSSGLKGWEIVSIIVGGIVFIAIIVAAIITRSKSTPTYLADASGDMVNPATVGGAAAAAPYTAGGLPLTPKENVALL